MLTQPKEQNFLAIEENDWDLDKLSDLSEEEAHQLIEHSFYHGWSAVANLLKMY